VLFRSVDGAGSTWDSGELIVGYDGDGVLNITNGGIVNSDMIRISELSGNGEVTVDGAASKLNSNWGLLIGIYGDSATLNINNGGEVQSAGNTYVGGVGTINFDGGTLNTDGLEAAVVDLTGTGTINTHGLVSDVDLVFDSPASLNQTLILNSQPGQNITLNLDISGPDVPVLGAGHRGAGSIMIKNGVTIKSTSFQIANDSNSSTATATVDGVGSTLDAGWLNVGNGGNGTLNIINNGSVNSDIAYIGRWSGSVGVVRINGAGSMWTNSSDLIVGDWGSGVLNITNGGVVSVAGTLTIDFNDYGDVDSFINMATGGILALNGDADDSLLAFLGLIDGTDAI